MEEQQMHISMDQPLQEARGTPTWLPFGFTWKRAWRLSTTVMPLFCLLSLIGLGMGVYEGITTLHFDPLLLVAWAMVNIVLWIIVVLHTVIDLLVVRHWENGDWDKVWNNYTGALVATTGVSLFLGGIFMGSPDEYGVSSFFLLISLGMLTFIDIWVLNHMRERHEQNKEEGA